MVGALADWFAVTALFRHPMGLPIPHTAIIPRKKDQIGASLGTFVQENFLTRDRGRGEADHDRRARPARRLPRRPGAGRAAGRGRVRRPVGADRAAPGRGPPARRRRAGRPQAARDPGRPGAGPRAGTRRRRRPAPGGALGGAAADEPLPAREPRGVPGAARRRLPRVGARLGRRPGLRPRVRRRAAVPRRGRHRSAARAAPLLRRPAPRLRARPAHRPGHRRPGRGAEEGGPRAPRRPHLVGLAVDQREGRRPRRRRRSRSRSCGPG